MYNVSILDFQNELQTIIKELQKEKIDFALIGGLAMHFWGYSRATHDLDFIILAKQKERVQQKMNDLGFKIWNESENVAHYEHNNSRVDFIYAHKLHGLKIIERAYEKDFFGQKLKVAIAEDIIGLKVQALANDPQRWLKEMADIENLLAENKGRLDMELIGSYFGLFQLEKDWDALLRRYNETIEG